MNAIAPTLTLSLLFLAANPELAKDLKRAALPVQERDVCNDMFSDNDIFGSALEWEKNGQTQTIRQWRWNCTKAQDLQTHLQTIFPG